MNPSTVRFVFVLISVLALLPGSGAVAAQDPRPPLLDDPSAEPKLSDPPAPREGSSTSTKLLAPAGKSDDAVRNLEGAAQGLAPPGGVFGVDSPASGPLDDSALPSGEVPELHTVKKGDTLWSLCGLYFRDPWRWPKLWSQNPLITNPHWIFPGDVVRIRAPDGTSAVGPVAAGEGTQTITSTRQWGTPGSVMLRAIGYIEAKDLVTSAVISGSREEKIMLSTRDQAYLTFRKERPLRAGERYTIFLADTERPVRNPDDGSTMGYLVRIYGDVVVDQVSGDTSARGTLVDLVDPVERGYLVSPVVRQFRRIEPRPSAVNLEAKIVASFSPARMLAQEVFVVLSRGRKDGIAVGNRTFVVRRGDGYRRIMEGWEKFDPRFPKEVVGELLVVEVRDSSALAWIARSNKEIRVGETTELHKGH